MTESPPDLVFVGAVEFDLHGASVERLHWVAADAGRVTRQLILQREWFAEPGRTYRWTVTEPARVDGELWQHGVYAWSVAAFAAADPEAEVARTTAFLAEQGFEQGNAQLMARYARVVGEDRRREEIVFYQDDLAGFGHRLEEVADAEGGLRPAFAYLAEGVLARSRLVWPLVRPELGEDRGSA